MSNREIRWLDPTKATNDCEIRTPASTKPANDREVRWLDEEDDFFVSNSHLGGFIGSSVLIAHRTKASDSILYNCFLARALAKECAVFFPLKEPHQLPGHLHHINIKSEKVENRKRFQKGKVYRLSITSYESDTVRLEAFYDHLLEAKSRDFPFVIIFDTLRKWTSPLEEHIRFLLRESPLVQGSVWLHCPLSNVPPDLLSIFGSVIVIWPSRHEINLLNSHFPSETIPLAGGENQGQYNNRMLVFKSKPISERGWKWKKFTGDS